MDLNNFEFWRKNKRYLKALLAGLLSSIVSAFVVALIFDILSKALPVLFGADLLFVAAGYFIGECIRRFGHGVGKKFYVTAAVFTFLSIILARHFIYVGYSIPTIQSITFILARMLQPTLNNVLSILWLSVALGAAYKSAESSR